MKTVEKQIGRLFVSIAILLVFGNTGFAATNTYGTDRNEVVSGLHTDDHEPFVFDIVSIADVSSTLTHYEYFGLGLVPIFHSEQVCSFAHLPALSNSFYDAKDKRELIFQYLFPYHFFW